MSAIEIYQRAYDADYRKGDWQYAEELYREIVEKYPYSDEKEYAMVHLERLEKLKGNPKEPSLQPVRGGSGVNGLSVLSFILIIFLTAAGVFGGYLFWEQIKINAYNDLILKGVLNEKTGNFENARVSYEEAQAMHPQSSLAYRYLAELYLSQNKMKLAEIESRRWEVTSSSGDRELQDFKRRLKMRYVKGEKGEE